MIGNQARIGGALEAVATNQAQLTSWVERHQDLIRRTMENEAETRRSTSIISQGID